MSASSETISHDYQPPEPAAQNRTARDVILVTGGRVGLLAAWFLATMRIGRSLGPDSFGLYTLCQNAIRIFTGCFGDPLDMAVMREAPLYLKTDRPRALAIIRSAFWLRGSLGVVAILVAALLPWAVSWLIFGSTNYRLLSALTAVGILGDLLLRSALGFFQVSERFAPFMAVDVVWQLGRTIAVVLLWSMNVLTAHSAIALYVAAPYVAFAAALLLLPRDITTPRPPHREHVSDIFHYSKWMVAAMMMAAIYERLDLFMLSRFRSKHDVGIYAGAMALAVIPDFLNGCIQTVLAPKVAPSHAAGTFNRLWRQYVMIALPLGLLALAAAQLLAGPVIRAFLSTKFGESIPAFQVLIISTVFNIVVTPLPSALLNFVAPRKVTLVTMTGLILVAAGGLTVIPHYGPVGAAIVILAARVCIGLLIVALVLGIERRHDLPTGEEPTVPLPVSTEDAPT